MSVSKPRERASIGTVDDLHEAATRMTGLSDFGTTEYLEPLELLVAGYTEEAGLTGVGNTQHRSFLRGALAARLMVNAACAQRPEYADVPITRPLFVTGIQRSGTTALQRLLHADPHHQGLEMWLTQVPQPRPPRETWDDDPVYAMLKAGFAQHAQDHPEAAGMHFMAADTVEECWQILRQTFITSAWPALAHLPTFTRWLREEADWVPSYERHKQNLQLIGLNDPDKRWVLKNPSHLDALDALMTVYPDALVVQTHRDPVVAVGSACSLAATTTSGWSTRFVGEQIGQDTLDLLSWEVETFREARSRYPAEQFVDVQYDDLVVDPIGTVRSIYAAFDLPWDDEVAAAVQADHDASRRGPRAPRHTYDLADYGLTPGVVRERFAPLQDSLEL